MAGFGQNDEVVSPKAKTFGGNDDIVAESGSAVPSQHVKPSIMDRIGDTVGFQNILHGVDDFGNSVRDVFTGGNGSAKLPMSERLGNAVSSIPVVGQPLTESAHALARLSGVESQVPGGSAGRDALRAIPVAGPIVQQPFEDVAAGRNVEGLSNLAMIGLGLAGRGSGMRVSEPIQPMREPETPAFLRPVQDELPIDQRGLPAMNPAIRIGARFVPHGHLATRVYDAARVFSAGGKQDAPGVRMYGPPMDISTEQPIATLPRGGSMGRGLPPGFGPSPNAAPPPVEVGGAHIPDRPYIYPLTQPGEETQMFRQATSHDPFRDLMERMQSSPKREGGVIPSGFGPSPNALTIPQLNARSLPEGVTPIRSIVPPQEAQIIESPLTPPPSITGTNTGNVVFGRGYGKSQSNSPITGGSPGSSAITNAQAEMMRQRRLADAAPATPIDARPVDDLSPLLEQSIQNPKARATAVGESYPKLPKEKVRRR